jgi:phospholipid/cholesterol/gamma-HCH transport system permease protein
MVDICIRFVDSIGLCVLDACGVIGEFTLFFLRALKAALTTQLRIRKTLAQANSIGVDSLGIVVLTGTFSGMVFALQSYIGFQRVGGEQFIGAVVALGMIRELGPVLTGLMVTGRAGSAIAAEIGTMRITEQLDALKTLRINAFQYLVTPRIIAGIFVLPCLALFAMICGIVGGYCICVYVLNLSAEDYANSIRTYVELRDITGGLVKSACFGFILTLVGNYKGFYTRGGAYGVGISTTQSVVISSVMILIANYFLTKFIEFL